MTRLAIAHSSATTVEIGGRELLYFGGCDYLGLAHDPRVVEALRGAALRFGVSAGASRETTGSASAHEALEADLARWLGFEAAVLLPDGYTANLAAAQALAQDGGVALIDQHAHPSLFDAAAAARLRVLPFAHGRSDRVLELLSGVDPAPAVVMTDSAFPLRGEIAPVAELAAAVEDHPGAWLVLDDCHGTGVLGACGRGALERARVSSPRALVTSTLSKALGCYGGFVAGSREAVERVRARSQLYFTTTPIPPALAAAASAALELAFASDARVRRLRENVAYVRERNAKLAHGGELPVLAIELASAECMRATETAMRGAGILAPYVRYPGGPAEGCIRVAISAAHAKDDLDRLLTALAPHLGA